MQTQSEKKQREAASIVFVYKAGDFATSRLLVAQPIKIQW